MRRLSRAGFKHDFVRSVIMPEWWDEQCSDDLTLLPDVELRLARFLGLSMSVVRDPTIALESPRYPQAQLRRVKTIDRDRLGPAMHTAIRIAGAAVRSLREKVDPEIPPSNPLEWRKTIQREASAVTLNDILTDLWQRGIPVVLLGLLPAPRFQGMSCIVEDRPVIFLGRQHDEPGRVAHFVVHETGHIAAGHCAPQKPVVHGTEDIRDNTEIEKRAERYATAVLVGSTDMPKLSKEDFDFKSLAHKAVDLELESGVDASATIFAWASRTGEYATATLAVKALYRHSGARQRLREMFDRYVATADASESDRALLRCVYGDSERDEVAD